MTLNESKTQTELEVKQNDPRKFVEIETTQPVIKIRYLQLCLLTLVAIISGFKSNLSVAIIAMTNQTSLNPDVPVYDWTNTSIILSSFYWTYFIVQFFSAYLGQTHGPKWYVLAGMSLNSLATIIIPVFASTSLGANGVIACRLVQGFALGSIIPLLHTLLGRWAPAHERSWMNTTVYSGFLVGGIISSSLTGVISTSWSGWPASFYLFGTIGFAWCILWIILGSNSPAEDSRITSSERNYIEMSLGQENYTRKVSDTPWKAIFRSVPVWAIIVAAIGEAWGNTLLSTEIPTYLSKTTGLNIQSNGLISSAPTAAAAIVSLCIGPLADMCIAKNWLSRANTRRLSQGIGCFIPSAALLWLAYVSESVGLVTLLLIVAVGATSGTLSGHVVNVIDISPKYSGIIWGTANGIGQGVAILAPVIVHFVVTDETDETLWRIMFVIAAAIYAGTTMFFITFLSGEKLPWDYESYDSKDNKCKIKKLDIGS